MSNHAIRVDDATASELRQWFEVAAEMDPARRAQWLQQLPITAATRRSLESLLVADAIEDDVLSTPAPIWPPTPAPTPFEADALIGSRVGEFELISILGQGGSAVVFRARRARGGARQHVALKLMRHGLFSHEAQRRFHREQSLLAQLSHPNIAHLIDAGISEAGVPFIAVELVDGLTLTDYAAIHELDLRARLQLLVQLCHTVDYAHRALVVHRDLKPSNVLVSTRGEIKVLDFGVAKWLSDTLTTATHEIALTPSYAAPEQFQSGMPSTSVDVYALGVIASELLLGARLGVDGSLPRDGLQAEKLADELRHLDRDLYTILRTALAGEARARYPSARGLADDIDRFLQQRPILARAPSARYRLRKFLARHRALVAISSGFLIVLMAAVGLALWQAGVAREEARRARSVSDFVSDLFAPLRDGISQAKQPSLSELVAQGVIRMDQTANLSPTAKVELLFLFARLSANLNEHEQARQLRERAQALAQSASAAGLQRSESGASTSPP